VFDIVNNYLAGAETWFEQHLKIRAGMVTRNKCIGRARILPKRSSPRWGEQAVMREQVLAPANLICFIVYEEVYNEFGGAFSRAWSSKGGFYSGQIFKHLFGLSGILQES